MFIVIDGEDFTGKSTVVEKLTAILNNAGHTTIAFHDPNKDLPLSKQLRDILLHGESGASHTAEMFCFLAARAELNHHILSALEDYEIVICDRYVASTVAYQAFGRQNLGLILPICSVVATLDSDATYFLSVNETERAKRFTKRGDDVDQFDDLGKDFIDRMKKGYAYCVENPSVIRTDRVLPIDTSNKSVDHVVELILSDLESML